MSSLVIVDDEKIVRLGIKSLIAEASPSCVVAGMFANGKDALEHCLREPPDIVLTDIKMPVMDGLELIERLRAACPGSRIVVLSSHDDYRFVRSAFRLGAEEYLLKHEAQADPRDLSGAFDARGLPAEGAAAALARLAAEKGGREAGRYAVACVSFKSAYDEDFRVLPWRPEPYALLETMQDAFAGMAGSIALRTGEERFACLFRHDGEGLIHKRDDVGAALLRLLGSMGAYINRQAVVGLSERALPLADIGAAFAEAAEASSLAFYREGNCILYRGAAPSPSAVPGPAGAPRAEEEGPSFGIAAAAALEAWRAESRRWFALLREGEYPRPEAAKRAALVAITNLERRIAECAGETEGACADDELGLVGRIDSARTLEAWVEARLLDSWSVLEGQRGASTLIGAVRRVVEAEYADDITLEGTARRFNVSKNYLCILFRRETGVNFVEYLNRVRVARANELLVGTSLSAKEISARIGYRNPNYFSRIFKRIEGRTVTGFRN